MLGERRRRDRKNAASSYRQQQSRLQQWRIDQLQGDQLICFFPVLVNAVKALKAADTEYRELFQTLGATRAQEFRKLRIPYCLPYLFSALKISCSLAIVGEFVGATQGLGYLIVVSSAHLETATLFAKVAAAALAGIVLFYVIGCTEERVIFYHSGNLE